MNFDEALALLREPQNATVGNLDTRTMHAMAEEIEQLRQDVAALKAWRDSATTCEVPACGDCLTFGIPDGIYSMDAELGIFEYRPLPAEQDQADDPSEGDRLMAFFKGE